MHEIKLTVPLEQRYYQLGSISAETKEIWFVCHGQGQLARYFIKNFESISSPERCIIAPEGLSKYYLNGFAGRVGASWMTSENRETEIRNYNSYLKHVQDSLKAKNESVKIVILGFSQGAATVSRWVNSGAIRPDHLILWAGLLPPDLDFESGKHQFALFPTIFTYGLSDDFIIDLQLREMKQRCQKLAIEPYYEIFNGKHEIHQETLKRIANELISAHTRP